MSDVAAVTVATASAWDLQQWTTLFTLIQNVVLIATGVIGSVLAVKGYRAWHDQLRGTDKYTVGKRVLHALFNFSDAIDHVRNPFMYVGEFQYPEGTPAFPSQEVRAKGIENAYNARLKILYDARKELVFAIQDCAVLEGFEYRGMSKPFLAVFAKVTTAVQMHVQEQSRGSYMGEQTDADRKWRDEQQAILYSHMSDKDPIVVEMSKAVGDVENKIRNEFMKL